ncbi:MAG: hypothetical protein NTV09_10870 [Bacteroidetes bacterium]|nr:hypothetical protein [Bacteroidota bacterium]
MQHIKLIIPGIFILLVNLVFAQDSLNVSQVEKAMSHGTHIGFTIDIPQAKLKDVVNAWKKYIKRGETKASVESNEDEYQISGTALTNISAQPMNVYTTIKEAEKAIRITSFFTEDDSNFISTSLNAEKASATEKLMKDFARMQYRLAVENELNDETKNLEKLENEKEDLINDNEKSNKNISEYERKIDRAKAEIESNGSEQSKRRADVANQKEIVRSTTPKTETYDLEEKKLNSLEKELKKLEKQGENLHSDIDGWNSDIRSEKRKIEKTDDEIKEKKEAMSKQKDHVKDVKEKMLNIR